MKSLNPSLNPSLPDREVNSRLSLTPRLPNSSSPLSFALFLPSLSLSLSPSLSLSLPLCHSLSLHFSLSPLHLSFSLPPPHTHTKILSPPSDYRTGRPINTGTWSSHCLTGARRYRRVYWEVSRLYKRSWLSRTVGSYTWLSMPRDSCYTDNPSTFSRRQIVEFPPKILSECSWVLDSSA